MAKTYRVRGNAVRAPLYGKLAHQALEPRLRRGIGRAAGIGVKRVDGGDRHIGRLARGAEARKRRLCEEEGALQIGREDAIPIAFRQILRVCDDVHAGQIGGEVDAFGKVRVGLGFGRIGAILGKPHRVDVPAGGLQGRAERPPKIPRGADDDGGLSLFG